MNQWKNKLDNKFLFNFLAKDRENAKEVMEASKGYAVPGIVASDFIDEQEGAQKVIELKEVADVISIGLGGGGNPDNWKKVMEIADKSNPGHINQPFSTSVYVRGYLEGKGIPQLVNALVVPSGNVGTIKLTSGLLMKTEEFVQIAKDLGIESIKFMPANGLEHLEELVDLTKRAAEVGIRGIEPAGGISAENIQQILDAVKSIEIGFFMPHIFGSTIDKETKRTIPEEIEKIMRSIGV